LQPVTWQIDDVGTIPPNLLYIILFGVSMDLTTLCAVLQACGSIDQAQRTAAEATLKQVDHAGGTRFEIFMPADS